MATRKTSAVTISSTAPKLSDMDENPQMLYRPTPQIDDPKMLKVSFRTYTPDQASHLLLDADSDPEFHQRPLKQREVRRWMLLMESGRFVNYLPNGPLCFDPAGMLLNGKHRLTALTRQPHEFGFMVVDNVPRWMFAFFDSGRPRTINDVFAIAGRVSRVQTGSVMRLAMRYEEFLNGVRRSIGWRSWGAERDEHFDVDEFLARREDLNDLYLPATRTAYGCKLIVSSLMVWRFYQEHAWPEGADAVAEFAEGLHTGSMPSRSPALALRAWGRDIAETRERIAGKRELHLLLLNRMFALHVQGDRVSRIQWAHGFPMTTPYHPDGQDTAVKNVLDAMRDLDKQPGR